MAVVGCVAGLGSCIRTRRKLPWCSTAALRCLPCCSTVTCQGHPPSETPQPFVSLSLHILPDSVSGCAPPATRPRTWLLPAALVPAPAPPHHGGCIAHLPCCLPRCLQVKSVDDALDLLTATESISGYKPQDTSAPTEATKVVRLQRLPPLLVLFLMRFDPANLHQKIRWVPG